MGRSIIVSGLRKSRAHTDEASIVEMCEDGLGLDVSHKIASTQRVGRIWERRVQNLLVTFTEKALQQSVLKYARELREDPKFEGIYINPSLTTEEQVAGYNKRLLRRQQQTSRKEVEGPTPSSPQSQHQRQEEGPRGQRESRRQAEQRRRSPILQTESPLGRRSRANSPRAANVKVPPSPTLPRNPIDETSNNLPEGTPLTGSTRPRLHRNEGASGAQPIYTHDNVPSSLPYRPDHVPSPPPSNRPSSIPPYLVPRLWIRALSSHSTPE